MENKIRKNILDKIDNQLKSASGMKMPIILVIDRTRAIDVDTMDIMDAIFGSIRLGVVVNKNPKRKVKPYWSRARDSISDQSPFGNVISGIFLIQRDMDENDKKIKWHGDLFQNPRATIPLEKKTIQILKELLLLNSI